MKPEELQLYALKGAISELQPEQQAKIKTQRERIMLMIAEDQENTSMAIGWIGLECSLDALAFFKAAEALKESHAKQNA